MNFSNTLLRQIGLRNRRTGNVTLFTNCRSYGKYHRGFGKKFGIWFREESVKVVKACTRQLEGIAAQKIRRSLQLFNLYTKIWDEVALRAFLQAWRRKVRRNAKDFLFSSAGLTIFNWEKERINQDELYSYANEIENIHQLKDATVVCRECHLRLIVDKEQSDVTYCKCHGKEASANTEDNSAWQPFIERKDMLVWRREEPETGGLFAYKVFGTFSDVTANEFLSVLVDVDYRKEWDTTAKRLEIIDTDPESISTKNQRNDVIYWEMIWPRLFSNRDYVFQRRWVLDEEKGVIVIVSRVTDHPNAPSRPDTYRVTSYWSYMVIKPCKSFSEPGIEFGLTYFDDPGVNIPSAVSTWVAVSGLPDFLDKMRQAAKDYKTYIAKKQLGTPNEQSEEIHDVKGNIILSDQQNEGDANRVESTVLEAPSGSVEEKIKNDDLQQLEEDESSEISEQTVEKQNGYLRYFFLTKLFA